MSSIFQVIRSPAVLVRILSIFDLSWEENTEVIVCVLVSVQFDLNPRRLTIVDCTVMETAVLHTAPALSVQMMVSKTLTTSESAKMSGKMTYSDLRPRATPRRAGDARARASRHQEAT